jgi:hypothetical protein
MVARARSSTAPSAAGTVPLGGAQQPRRALLGAHGRLIRALKLPLAPADVVGAKVEGGGSSNGGPSAERALALRQQRLQRTERVRAVLRWAWTQIGLLWTLARTERRLLYI